MYGKTQTWRIFSLFSLEKVIVSSMTARLRSTYGKKRSVFGDEIDRKFNAKNTYFLAMKFTANVYKVYRLKPQILQKFTAVIAKRCGRFSVNFFSRCSPQYLHSFFDKLRPGLSQHTLQNIYFLTTFPGRDFVGKKVRIAVNSGGKKIHRKTPVVFNDQCSENSEFM